MAEISLGSGVWVAESALDFSTARSGGPGGQHVNKVETKVELRLDPAAIVGLSPGALARLLVLAGRKLLPDGRLAIVAQESRHQIENKAATIEKLIALVAEALVPPKPRRATKPSRASKERRLDGKKKDAAKKKGRGRIDHD